MNEKKGKIVMFKTVLATSLLLSSVCVEGAGCQPAKNPQTTTVLCKENDVFFEVDFIYWVAKQQGNDFAVTGSAIAVPGTDNPILLGGVIEPAITRAGKVYAPDTKIKPGYKAALGVNLMHGGWDLISEYTYLYSKGDESVSSNNKNAGILPVFAFTPFNSILATTSFASIGNSNFVSAADADWSLHFNNITLELGKMMHVNSFFSMRPHFGLQGSWQNQHFKTKYSVSTSSFAVVGDNKVVFKQNYWGLGIRAGLDTTWKCCDHLALFANATVSGLWGHFKAKGKSYDTNNDPMVAQNYSNVVISNQINSFSTLSPVVQVELGLQSDWIFSDYYRFLVQAGWEEQIWFFQNQHSSVIADTSLILQGLTFKLRFDF